MKLVLAEKAVLGRDIARAITGKMVSEIAPLPISGNGYIVVALSGHLLSLKDPAQVNDKWAKTDKYYNLDALPIYIPNWPKELTGGEGAGYRRKLLGQVKDLIGDAEVVFNAGDPDDEGQILVDEVLDYLGYSGKVLRVLVSDNTPESVRRSFEEADDNANHVNTGRAAYARSMGDAAFGFSWSRLAAGKLHQGVSLGRVQTPTLGLVVARDIQIANHVVQKYYELTVQVDCDDQKFVPFKFDPSESFLAGDKKVFDRTTLENIERALAGTTEAITAKVTQKHKYAPLPYNLAVLQSDMNRRYGYSPSDTLAITQALRDKHKAISYNRSDCRYLKMAQHGLAEEVLNCAMQNLGITWNLDYELVSKAFNDDNVSDHFGIIPQKSSFRAEQLNEKEAHVYNAICKRYAMQFLPPVSFDECVATFTADDGVFTFKADHITDYGYSSTFGDVSDDEDQNENQDTGSNLWFEPGDYKGVIAGSAIAEKETSAPKRYTEGTLLTDMTSIAKYVTDPEIKEILLRKDSGKKDEHGGIGTSATRGAIIEKLKERGFIETQGKSLVSTKRGRDFYKLLPDEIKGVDLTARWWVMQEEIAAGELDINAIQQSVASNFDALKQSAFAGQSLGTEATVCGKCPHCGADLLSHKNTYACSTNRYKKDGDGTWSLSEGCGFSMFKTICGKKIPAKAVQEMIKGGTTMAKVSGMKSKKNPGETFGAFLDLDRASGKVSLRFK